MKRRLLLVLLSAIMLLSIAPVTWADPIPEGAIAIDAANFPDANFRTYLIDTFSPDLSGSTYYFTAEKIAEVKEIACKNKSITSLYGIGLFTELETLDCSNNNFNVLDLAGNRKLKSVVCTDCSIVALNVSTCTELEELDCHNNGLLNLDVTRLVKLKTLNCCNNSMTTLDVGSNSELTLLNCSGNKLISLNTVALGKLKTLNCSGNELNGISVAANPLLESFDCGGNNLKTLDVSGCTKLVTLSFYDNELGTVDLSSNTKLEQLYAYGNKLTAIDLSKNTKLKTLIINGNKLTGLDLVKNTNLVSLDCGDNEFTSLDLAKNTKLEWLNVAYGKLTSLGITKNTALKTLLCNNNKFATLDLTKNTALETLNCANNVLTLLNVASCTALKALDCSNNQLMTLDLHANAALTTVNLSGQTYGRTMLGNIKSGAYTFDLSKVVEPAYLPNVTLTDGSMVLNPTTGIVTLVAEVAAIEYTYNTGSAFALPVSVPTLFSDRSNVIMLNVDNPPTGSSAEVDGVTYPITEGMILLPDGVHPQVITQYKYNTTSADPHEVYPTAMRVWVVEKKNGVLTARYESSFDNILQYLGSSIRITGVKGIRMITGIPSDKRNALKSGTLNGYRVLEYGTIVAWDSDLMGASLTVKNKLAGNYAYKYDPAMRKTVSDAVFKRANGLVQFTNVLTFTDMAKCIPDLSLRAYMKVLDPYDTEMYIYGGTIHRNIGFIAYQNRAAFKYTTAAYKYIWEIIHAVYGTVYDAEYKAS